MQQQQNFHARQHSYDINKIPFPEGWSMSYTANGDRYFLNHNEKRTTWEDPRKEILVRELQNANPNSIAQIAQIQRQVPNTYSSQPNMVQSQQQQFADSRFDPSKLPLPDGWEQASTPTGDVYYLNLNEQTTTWFHPSFARQLQLKNVQLKQQRSGVTPPSFLYAMQQASSTASNGVIPPELVSALENMNTSSPSTEQTSTDLMQQQLQNSQVRELELERERLRQRRDEILQSSQLKTNYLPFNSQSSDPFLSSASVDVHGRQESIDSGLSLSSGINGSQLTLNSYTVNGTFGAGDQMLNANNVNNLHFSHDDLLSPMDQMTTAATAQHTRMNNNNNNNAHHTATGTMNHMDDLSFIDPIDLTSGNIDMDILTDVEELLNTNSNNIMTWL